MTNEAIKPPENGTAIKPVAAVVPPVGTEVSAEGAAGDVDTIQFIEDKRKEKKPKAKATEPEKAGLGFSILRFGR
jgi:hypothetical protein